MISTFSTRTIRFLITPEMIGNGTIGDIPMINIIGTWNPSVKDVFWSIDGSTSNAIDPHPLSRNDVFTDHASFDIEKSFIRVEIDDLID